MVQDHVATHVHAVTRGNSSGIIYNDCHRHAAIESGFAFTLSDNDVR